MEKKIKRCGWANYNQLEQEYHDEKWGIPVFEDKELFKMLCLEGMQAGLSWVTVLKKIINRLSILGRRWKKSLQKPSFRTR